jgi:hypothetical protein
MKKVSVLYCLIAIFTLVFATQSMAFDLAVMTGGKKGTSYIPPVKSKLVNLVFCLISVI